ncbi:MAG: hypothetical protein GY765_41260 [bacterium]|nr:hypothetical protein [bacterium]
MREKKQKGIKIPKMMVTFADMVTLLLCFFVLLLSFANMDVIKYREFVGSFRNVMGNPKNVEDFKDTSSNVYKIMRERDRE